jgi:hypothetical protein
MTAHATQNRQQRGGERDTPRGSLTDRSGEGMMMHLRNYARENPESAALWCFGIGFVLGWKLKPW